MARTGRRNILLINGHPDPRPERFCAALSAAYGEAAERAGHTVTRIDVGAIDFPMIRSQDDFLAPPPPVIAQAQAALRAADHLVIIFPLWLGGPPAVLKAFLEQVFRYGVAISAPGGPMRRLLKGKSAHVVVTMGMPAVLFRLAFGAYGLRVLTRGLLWMSGISPIRSSVLGMVGAPGEGPARRRLAWMGRLGAEGC